MIQKVQLKDWSPDLDSTTPGILTATQWIWSVQDGVWEVLPAPGIQAALPTGTRCLGAYQALVNTTQMAVFGVSNQLYVWNGTTFVNQNLTLSGSTTNPWSFTVYGNDLLATNGVDPIQVSTNGGTFTALGGSPPVSSIVAATDFSVFAITANSSTWTSTLTDTNWTPSIASSVASASITSTPGNITAAKALRSGIMMYKQASCFYGSFVGPPFFWQFTKVSGEYGTWGVNSVVSTGEIHYFVGPDDFYKCDGYSIYPMPNKLRRWFFAHVNQQRMAEIRGYYDQPHKRITWHFPSLTAAAGVLDTTISNSLITGYWSMDTVNVDTPVDGTFPTGSPYSLTAPCIAYVDSNHFLNYVNGTQSLLIGSITTYDIGDKTNIWSIKRVQPAFTIGPVTGGSSPPNPPLLTGFTTYVQGQTPLQGRIIPFSPSGFFDLVQAGRLQRLQINMISGQQIAELEVEMEQQGSQ